MTIKLYSWPRSSGTRVAWALEELGLPYEYVALDAKKQEHRAPEYLAVNPHGKVPALVHDGELVFESSAIALYLTDMFPEAKLGPLAGEPKRGEYLSWLFYRAGVMEPAFLERRFGIKHVYGAMGWAPPEEVEEVLNAALSRNKYLLGDSFTAADIMAGGGVYYMLKFKMMTETPVLKAYAERITDRPAFRKMMERDAKK